MDGGHGGLESGSRLRLSHTRAQSRHVIGVVGVAGVAGVIGRRGPKSGFTSTRLPGLLSVTGTGLPRPGRLACTNTCICANLNQPKRRNALERGEPALVPIYPDTQRPIYPDSYRPSPP
jgi:hypothetical protein